MLQVKLIDLYNTKYFYKTMCVDLNYLFSNVARILKGESVNPNFGNEALKNVYESLGKGDEVVFDLAGARLTSDACQAVVVASRSGVKFCDSQNFDRDCILRTNEERLLLNAESFEPLPRFDYRTDIKEYVKSLDSTKTYCVTGMSDKLLVALTCVITMLRPSVTLCIDMVSQSLFKFVATKVSNTALMDDDEFYYVTDQGLMEIKGKEKFYVQELQESVPIRDAVQYGIVVPKKFGRDVLLKDSNWSSLFKASLSIIEDYQSACPKRISEIYEV